MTIELHLGDCLEVMVELPENSVDTILTDPPYGLAFMGKDWDRGVPGVAFWREALRVAKPGAMLLAMGGTRTFHRLVVAIEDAGWEVRDSIAWLYGSGFPKSYNIEKGVNKYLKTGNASWNGTGDSSNGALGYSKLQHEQGYRPNDYSGKHQSQIDITEPAAQLWHGWGTALKPAMELICVAMKPIDGTYVNNALTWGVAGLWIDGGRVGSETITQHGRSETYSQSMSGKNYAQEAGTNEHQGRFPANVIHDGSDEVTGLFPQCKQANDVSEFKQLESMRFSAGGQGIKPQKQTNGKITTGSAARFFMACKQDDPCSLCLAPKHSIMSDIDNSEVIRCKNISANNVEKNLTTTQATIQNIAQENVPDWLIEKAVHFAKSVGNLCDSCATSIVREVAEIKTWDSKRVASQVIQDFIGNSNECILIQNLAHYAGLMESIDTTQTTTSLSKLFGCASRVITNYIQETEKTAPKRFLYTAKASRSERNAGLEGMEAVDVVRMATANGTSGVPSKAMERFAVKMQNSHPTVKPLALMRYLARLTKTPTGGVVLDPFMGSGTTGIAAVLEGRDFIGIELNPEYLEIAERRIADAQKQLRLPLEAE